MSERHGGTALWRQQDKIRVLKLMGKVAGSVQPNLTMPDSIADDFGKYGGDQLAQSASSALSWLQLARFETTETWAGGTSDATYAVEGARAIRHASVASISVGTDGAIYDYGSNQDFTADGRFGASDYISLFARPAASITNLSIFFLAPDATNYYYKIWTSLTAIQNFLSVLRSDFTAVGTPSWTTVRKIQIAALEAGAVNVHVDNLQIIKASPLDGTVSNAFGDYWITTHDGTGVWTVLTDMLGQTYALAQLKTAAAVYVALYNGENEGYYTANDHYGAGVLAREDGALGLLFCAADGNNGYVLKLNTTANTLGLYDRLAGVDTLLGSAVTYASVPNVVYYLGMRRLAGGIVQGYITLTPGTMYQANNLKISYDDSGGSNHEGGRIGVVSYGINSRFARVRAGSPEHSLTAEWSDLAQSAYELRDKNNALVTDFNDDGELQIHGNPVIVNLIDEDAAANQQIVQLINDGGDFLVRRVDDDGASSPVDLLHISNAGSVEFNQGAADTAIAAFGSSDVAHGMTDFAETDDYLQIVKVEATSGGAHIIGYKDADGAAGYALALTGRLGEAADTAKTTSAIGVVHVGAQVKSGTGVTVVGANGNLLVVANSSTARFILDAEGDSHQDVGTAWTNFDLHDDVALLTQLSVQLSNPLDPIRQEFREFVDANRKRLEELKIVTFNDDGHHFINWSRANMLVIGAIRQQAARLDRLERVIRRIPLLERWLLA